MILRSLATQNFRNLAEQSFAFHPETNLILGDNGQGKTNLLEAIYFLATTKSFRTPRSTTLVRIAEATVHVAGTVDRGSLERTLSIGLDASSERRRELRINQEKVTLQRYIAELSVIAYSAARLEILRGGPEERRRFLDRGIASTDRGYLQELTRYTRTLQQRNALLQRISERRASESMLDAWDAQLLEAALPVVRARAAYSEQLSRAFKETGERHDYHVRDLQLRYEPAALTPGVSIDEGRAAIGQLRRRELAAGFTLWGPHRDNLLFELSGRPAAEILSSGELKVTVLFLKLAKLGLLEGNRGEKPLFLLDDLDAELDLAIIEKLLVTLTGRVQLFTTSAKASIFEGMSVGNHRRILLKNGVLTGSFEES